jgi:hypothetical protein
MSSRESDDGENRVRNSTRVSCRRWFHVLFCAPALLGAMEKLEASCDFEEPRLLMGMGLLIVHREDTRTGGDLVFLAGRRELRMWWPVALFLAVRRSCSVYCWSGLGLYYS